jgi:hypothetical protein
MQNQQAANANQGNALPQGQAQPVANNIAFALSPARATQDVLNFMSKHGMSVWEKGLAKLSDSYFNCSAKGLCNFLELVEKRSDAFGWDNSILEIPEDPANILGPTRNFLRNYLDYLRLVCKQNVNTQTRAAQDLFMLYTCLHDSLTEEGRNKVTQFKESYMVGGTPSGIMFLKIII